MSTTDLESLTEEIRHALKTRTFPPDPATGLGGLGLNEFDLAQLALDWFHDHGPRYALQRSMYEPTTCQVYDRGMLVFSGRDFSADLARS